MSRAGTIDPHGNRHSRGPSRVQDSVAVRSTSSNPVEAKIPLEKEDKLARCSGAVMQ